MLFTIQEAKACHKHAKNEMYFLAVATPHIVVMWLYVNQQENLASKKTMEHANSTLKR